MWHSKFAKIHKWAGLVIAVQLLFWTVGGVIMSWNSIERVRGEHKITDREALALPVEKMIAVSDLKLPDGQIVERIEYRTLLTIPVIDIRFTGGERQIVDAVTGHPVSPVPADLAQQIAVADYKDAPDVASITRITHHSSEYRSALPAWQVEFADSDTTRIYIDEKSGRVTARRSDLWRLYDFFWMLHIMDYDTRHDFNNPLIMIFSAAATLFILTGFGMLYYRLIRRWKRYGRKRAGSRA